MCWPAQVSQENANNHLHLPHPPCRSRCTRRIFRRSTPTSLGPRLAPGSRISMQEPKPPRPLGNLRRIAQEVTRAMASQMAVGEVGTLGRTPSHHLRLAETNRMGGLQSSSRLGNGSRNWEIASTRRATNRKQGGTVQAIVAVTVLSPKLMLQQPSSARSQIFLANSLLTGSLPCPGCLCAKCLVARDQ